MVFHPHLEFLGNCVMASVFIHWPYLCISLRYTMMIFFFKYFVKISYHMQIASLIFFFKEQICLKLYLKVALYKFLHVLI